jgi:hypothetical protein
MVCVLEIRTKEDEFFFPLILNFFCSFQTKTRLVAALPSKKRVRTSDEEVIQCLKEDPNPDPKPELELEPEEKGLSPEKRLYFDHVLQTSLSALTSFVSIHECWPILNDLKKVVSAMDWTLVPASTRLEIKRAVDKAVEDLGLCAIFASIPLPT